MTDRNIVMGTQWEPVSAEEYVERCRRQRLARKRRVDAAIRKLLAFAVGMFIWAVALAAVVG